MFITLKHLDHSLQQLKCVHPFFGMSFLAFKRADLPVGRSANIIFMNMAEDFLREFYKPSSIYEGFYNPFKTSNPRQRWVKPRYPSTSLQRITADTFGRVFLHTKDSSRWGWHPDYVERLAKFLKGTKIPAVHLASWLFRESSLPSTHTAEWLVDQLIEAFRLLPKETKHLFDLSTADFLNLPLSSKPYTEQQLIGAIGSPPGHAKHRGLVLDSLTISNVGPSQKLTYLPSDRLNLITGDNSLGKTFLLDCLWWALTDDWTAGAAIPTAEKGRYAKIEAELADRDGSTNQSISVKGRYIPERVHWARTGSDASGVPLTIYARYDGSFFVWNPVLHAKGVDDQSHKAIHLGRDEVWDGKLVPGNGRLSWICNGLVRDWASWQIKSFSSTSYEFEKLVASLQRLSPSEDEPLSPGDLIRLPGDSRDMPSLIMPYGQIPISHASAGVKRILAIAYLLVWAWQEHVVACNLSNRRTDDRMIVLIDEIEAHLHPRWQRSITPAIMEVVSLLSVDLSPQVHLATHSPMVLASAEPIFDYSTDSLHHLEYRDNQVALSQIQFVRHGKVDSWLTSDSFGLRHARSIISEKIIERAKLLQLQNEARKSDVLSVHKQLRDVLADDDEFWPRWLFYAKSHGVTL